jgi:hypothetical protein
MLEIHNARFKSEIFNKKSFDVFIEGFYNSSKNANQKTADQEGESSDDEDDADIAMIDEMFPQAYADREIVDETLSEDDAEISASSTKIT